MGELFLTEIHKQYSTPQYKTPFSKVWRHACRIWMNFSPSFFRVRQWDSGAHGSLDTLSFPIWEFMSFSIRVALQIATHMSPRGHQRHNESLLIGWLCLICPVHMSREKLWLDAGDRTIRNSFPLMRLHSASLFLVMLQHIYQDECVISLNVWRQSGGQGLLHFLEFPLLHFGGQLAAIHIKGNCFVTDRTRLALGGHRDFNSIWNASFYILKCFVLLMWSDKKFIKLCWNLLQHKIRKPENLRKVVGNRLDAWFELCEDRRRLRSGLIVPLFLFLAGWP